MNGPLYMQTANNTVLVRRLKRKGDGPMKQLARWFIENQIGFCFNILALLFCTHFLLPKAQSHTVKYFTLSYYHADTGKYGIGSDDGYFIAFFIVLLTGLRAVTMEYMFAPLAKRWGISKKKEVTRFSEQAWNIVWYGGSSALGVYLYYTSPYWLNMKELWTDWPNRELGGLMKAYLLWELVYYTQQCLILNIEERRKDHWQMFSHHLITIVLIYGSYRFGHTRVGNVILVLMDTVDVVLVVAKCTKYLGFTRVCDALFGLFMLSWFVNRHIIYNLICWSVWEDTPKIMPTGCFRGAYNNLTGPFEIPEGTRSYLSEAIRRSDGLLCYDDKVMKGFLACLVSLQLIMIVWFFMIVKVAVRVINGTGADDVRSDDEAGDSEDEEEFIYEEAQPLEEEVGVEEIDLKNWERRTGVKRQASTSGVSLPGHSDRKELLGRIGCEKQVE
ncbi:putative longevity-assurance protein [Phaeoacremonium minimum UCRPA7]|uniref:Putative longevity-assurance protein n=1 Tax=Phaeoacremonium minimum (strain UCR-PA7) TaxID=1286976 RepID=R8BJV1_PHAM7|nr:putative longevity-assurance protein [Phaeoacremonium minimum UCRPA7]EON99591.1 putative longevity-assurance protein [Phaeoacremonium minimum UCRPA7]